MYHTRLRRFDLRSGTTALCTKEQVSPWRQRWELKERPCAGCGPIIAKLRKYDRVSCRSNDGDAAGGWAECGAQITEGVRSAEPDPS